MLYYFILKLLVVQFIFLYYIEFYFFTKYTHFFELKTFLGHKTIRSILKSKLLVYQYKSKDS